MQVDLINNNFPPKYDEDIDFDAPPVGLYNLGSNELVPIKFADVEADIHDNFARVTIKHFYENLFSNAIDTEFVFPKTKAAIFDSLKASLDNGEEIIAEVLSYQEGNKRFNEAKQKGDLAILADIEKTKPDLVKTKIGNIAPGQKVKITFSYVTQLDISLDKYYQFKFANIFIPRYASAQSNSKNIFENENNLEILPRIKFLCEADIAILNEEFAKLLLKDSDSSNKGYLESFENYFINNKDFIQYSSGSGMLYPWSIRVNINTTFNFSNLKYNNYLKNNNENEKLFNVEILNNNNNESRSAVLTSNALNFQYPKVDVIISFEDELGFKQPKLLLNQHPLHRNEFSLYFKFNPKFLSEPKANAVFNINQLQQQNLTNEVTGSFLFVIDRSGSMAGSRIQTAKDSLVYFLKSLPEKSQFNVVSFGSDYQLLYPDFIKANDESIKEALKKIEGFKADLGGTELYKPFSRIFADWKKNLHNFKNKQILRAFVLTDGSIDNADGFFSLLQTELKFFEKNNIDLRIYSLGIGSGCSEYLVKGIAEKGQGKSELAINNDDIVEKVIYLLDNSMKKNLKNFKIYFENNNKLNDSLIANSNVPAGEFNVAYKAFTETVEFFSKVDIDDLSLKTLEDNILIISYEDVDNTEEKFAIALERNLIQDDDTIFKIWVNQKVDNYFQKLAESEKYCSYPYDYNKNQQLELIKNQLLDLSIKYQCLNRLTSLFMVLKENNVNKELLKHKKFVSLSNSDVKEIEVPHPEEEMCFNKRSAPVHLNTYTAAKKKSGGLFSGITNAFNSITGLFGSSAASAKAKPQRDLMTRNTFSTNAPALNTFNKMPVKNAIPTQNSSIFSEKKLQAKDSSMRQNISKNMKKASPKMEKEKERSRERDRGSDKKSDKKAMQYATTSLPKQEEFEDVNMNIDSFGEMECENNKVMMDEFEDDECLQESYYPQSITADAFENKSALISPHVISKQSQVQKEDKIIIPQTQTQTQPQPSSTLFPPQVKQAVNVKLLESEILKSQNFNGSWNQTSALLNAMGLQNWDKLHYQFSLKYQNKMSDKTKEEKDVIIFTVYVLNFIKYSITEQKVLNKLKLIISKAEKFIINQLKIEDIYTTDIKFIFEF